MAPGFLSQARRKAEALSVIATLPDNAAWLKRTKPERLILEKIWYQARLPRAKLCAL